MHNTCLKTWNEFQKATAGWFESRQEAAAAWRAYRESNTTTNTLVIGSLKDTAAAAQTGGLQRLFTENWTPQVNDAWVKGAIDARRPLKLVTPVRRSSLYNPPGADYPTTIYLRELRQLKAAGYTIRNGWAIPPPPGG